MFQKIGTWKLLNILNKTILFMLNLEKELENTAIELEIAEDRVDQLRKKKWSIVRKLELGKYKVATALDDNEEWTLFDKIEKIKNSKFLT